MLHADILFSNSLFLFCGNGFPHIRFKGYLHTDGYAGYHSKLPEDVVITGCWAHARRKFEEALKGLAEKDREGSLALKGKRYCDRLFRIEKGLKDISPQNRQKKRQEQARPVLDEFLA